MKQKGWGKMRIQSQTGIVRYCLNFMGIASRTLKENSMAEEAKEMCDKIMQSASYEEAMCIFGEYVNITSIDEEMDECEEKQEEPNMGIHMTM